MDYHALGATLLNGESVEEGALAHGIKDIDSLVKDLNKVAGKSKIK
jgi:hypothetical protein